MRCILRNDEQVPALLPLLLQLLVLLPARLPTAAATTVVPLRSALVPVPLSPSPNSLRAMTVIIKAGQAIAQGIVPHYVALPITDQVGCQVRVAAARGGRAGQGSTLVGSSSMQLAGWKA